MTVGRMSCLVCRDRVWREYKNCLGHEHSRKHKSLVDFFDQESSRDSLETTRTVISGGLGAEELSIASNQSPILGPLSLAFYRTQTGHLTSSMKMAETGEDDRGFNSAASDELELGTIDLDYTLEDTVDSIIASKTSGCLDEWLSRGLDINSDSYSVDSDEEEPQAQDFDYTPGD